MPHEEFWSPPAIALVHRGVVVYHTYRHDTVNEGTNDYWYTLDVASDEGTGTQFDIRDYPVEGLNPLNTSDHPAILRALVEDPEWLDAWLPDDVDVTFPYGAGCPRCQADSPGFAVVACTFASGPDFTVFGVHLTPDDLPSTMQVQCRSCQATFDAEELRHSPKGGMTHG